MNLEHATNAAEDAVEGDGSVLLNNGLATLDIAQRHMVRKAVETASTLIAAQALRDAAWQAELDSPDDGVSPYWLRTRANELETK